MNLSKFNTQNGYLLAALGVFLLSIFAVVEEREQLRAEERMKNRARKMQIVLRDEWRNLSLEYATRTGYNEISAQAQRLGMVTPRPGAASAAASADAATAASATAESETFIYLSQPQPPLEQEDEK